MSELHDLSGRKIQALMTLLPSRLANQVENAWLDGTTPPTDQRITRFLGLMFDWPEIENSETILLHKAKVSANEMNDLLARFDLPGVVRITCFGVISILNGDKNKLREYMLLARCESTEVQSVERS
jgi:hypothetical protein